MKKTLLFLFLLNIITVAQQLQPDAQSLLQSSNNTFFIENKGQWDSQVRYLTKIGGLNAWITDKGVVYDYYKIERNYTDEELREVPRGEQDEFEIENTNYLNQVVRINYLNSLSTAVDEGLDKRPGHHNYYIGDVSRHAENVGLFGEVRVSEIYEGIDIRYYFDEGLLRYDYKAAPNADISQIRMEVEGADAVTINAGGELVMQTQFGEVIHGKLFAYQNEWYGVKPVECGFVKNTDGTVSVNTAEYDRNKELTIDPLVYSTYLGGFASDYGNDIGMTSGGDYIVTGWANSPDFPVTNGSAPIGYDLFITQINTNGTTLDYSSFYGNSGIDIGYALTIYNDPNDGIEKVGIAGTSSIPSTITGVTYTDFVTASASGYGALLVVFSVQDGSKQFDLMVDGNQSERLMDIGHDNSDQILLVSGYTGSTDIVFSNSRIGGTDVMLLTIPYSSPGDAIGFYYGGTNYEEGNSLTVRELTGNVFIAGQTLSTALPNTSGSVQSSHSAGAVNFDWFIVKIDPGDPLLGTPPSVIKSTFYGGVENDTCGGIAVEEASGDVYCGGNVGLGFPTVNPYQAAHNGGGESAFAKFSNDLSVCYFASYFGGSSDDNIKGVTVKDDNRPVFVGSTKSTNMPVTSGAEQSSNGGSDDVFISVFRPDGSGLTYGSYLGGALRSRAQGVSITPAGNILITGMTEDGFPVSGTTYQSTNAGQFDAFVSEFALTEEAFVSLTAPNGSENWAGGSSQNITWISNGVTNVHLEYSTNSGTNWTTIIASTAASAGSYSWTVPGVYSTNCLVRVSDASDGAVNDVSDAVFTIDNRSLTVTAPNGGENWRSGTLKAITWTAVSLTNVKIEYSTNSGTNWTTIIASTAASAGSYSWTVPDNPSTNCLVRITDVDDGTINDQSNAVFTIFTLSVTVNSPNGSENWAGGSSQNITWTSSSVTNVLLEYSTNNGTNWTTIIASTAASAGSYSWTTPDIYSAQCLVRVSDASDGTVNDVSNAVFTIDNRNVTVTAPNGGETWLANTNENITWSSNGITNVHIEYSTNNGTNWTTIIASTAASAGSYSWTTPDIFSPQCLVRVSDASDGTVNDVSNAVFTIGSCSVTVTAPNGGEKWLVSSSQQITWTSTKINMVDISYSTDGGSTFIPITSGTTASLGVYNWTIPSATSMNCIVKIVDSDNPGIYTDVSNSTFSITSLEVVSPNGGERYSPGDVIAVTWNFGQILPTKNITSPEGSSGAPAGKNIPAGDSPSSVTDVNVEFSDGSSWVMVGTNIPAGDLTFTFKAPEITSASCKVRVVNAANVSDFDESDAVFEINTEVANTISWSGTVTINQLFTVPEGMILYINAGTEIQMLFHDIDEDGRGDGIIHIEDGANIMVMGTVENPVVFSYDMAPAGGGPSWQGIVIDKWTQDSPNRDIIRFIEINGAEVGIQVSRPIRIEGANIYNCTEAGIIVNE